LRAPGAGGAAWRRAVHALGRTRSAVRTGAAFPDQRRVESSRRRLRCAGAHLRHAGDIGDRPDPRGAAEFRHRVVPYRDRADMVARSGRDGDRIAGQHPVDHLRHVGPVRVRAVHGAHRAGTQRYVGPHSVDRQIVRRATAGVGLAYCGHRAGGDDPAVHLLGDARGVPDGAEPAQGIFLRARLDDVGSGVGHRAAIHALGGDRRHFSRTRPRAGRDHGRDLRARQRVQHHVFAVDARHFDFIKHRQRIQRGGRHAPFGADRAGFPAVRGDLRGAVDLAPDAASARAAGGRVMALDIYLRRRAVNVVAMVLSGCAAAVGLVFLVWILWITVKNGLVALDLKLFTKITAYADQGGLANAIVGSLVMDMIALALCAPVGILAGTFLAEYANCTKLGAVIRFLNDILLSAPSIVLGLFVYVIIVLPMSNLTHGAVSFSGLAGAIALALIGLPVIVRTTDEMLQLVPGTLREAAL